MNRDALWSLFEKTGNIDAYMLYHNTGADNAANNLEAPANADEDRRPDNKGS